MQRWDDVSKVLEKEMIPLDYVYYKNTYLIELAMENNSPQNILFDWLRMGVSIHNYSMGNLIYSEKYAEFTYLLIKNKKLKNKRSKSMVFQATRSLNFELLKLLLDASKNNEFVDREKGVSPLNWVLLNYNDDLKPQLDLLLSQSSHLSGSEKKLLSKIR
jgi:hypothetical protein